MACRMQHRPTDCILLQAVLYCNTVVVTPWTISCRATVIFRDIALSVLFLLTNVFTGLLLHICVGPHSHYVAFILMYLRNNNTTHNLSWHAGKMRKGLHCSCFTVQWRWMRECVAHCWWAGVMIRQAMQMVSVIVNGNGCCLSLS